MTIHYKNTHFVPFELSKHLDLIRAKVHCHGGKYVSQLWGGDIRVDAWFIKKENATEVYDKIESFMDKVK